MKGVFFKLTALVCAILSVTLIGVISLPLPKTQYNLLAGYEDYTPGSDDYEGNPNCDYFDVYYSEGSYGLYCTFDENWVRTMIGNLHDNRTINDIYFYTRKCVPAAELMLTFDVEVRALNHHARYISWQGGHAYAWTRRGKIYTPYSCIFGIYLHKG